MTLESGLRWLITIVIVLMPLLAPMWLGVNYIFQPTPEDLKTAYGIVGVFLALFVWFFLQYRGGRVTIQKSDYYLPIAGFLIWCFITLFWIEDGFLAIQMLLQFISYAMIFFLLVNAFKKVEDTITIFKLLIYILCIVSIVGLLQYYLTDNSFIQNLFLQAHRPGATFANKNMASHFVVMTLPLAIVFLLYTKKIKGVIVYSVITFLAFLFLMYTHARQGYLAISVELAVLIIFIALDYIKNKKRSLILRVNYLKTKRLSMLFIVFLLVLIPNIKKPPPGKLLKAERCFFNLSFLSVNVIFQSSSFNS